MKTRHAREIGAFRTSGVNPRPAQQQSQQLAPHPAPVAPPTARSAPGYVPQRPEDATTVGEALAGLMAVGAPKLVTPRFASTAGPWVRLGEHETRLPPDVAISITRARDGRHIAIVAHLDQSESAGKVQVLVSTKDGVRELVGILPEHLRELRQAHFGK